MLIKKRTSKLVDGLTERQIVFCYAYIANHFNITKAAKEAGYRGSDVNASSWGNKQIKKNPAVREKIFELTEKYISQIDLRAADVIKEISLLAFRRMGDYVNIDPITGIVSLKTQEEIGEKDAAISRLKMKQRCALSGEECEPGKEYSVIDSEFDIQFADKVKPLEILANILNRQKDLQNENNQDKKVDLSQMSDNEIKLLISLQNKIIENKK